MFRASSSRTFPQPESTLGPLRPGQSASAAFGLGLPYLHDEPYLLESEPRCSDPRATARGRSKCGPSSCDVSGWRYRVRRSWTEQEIEAGFDAAREVREVAARASGPTNLLAIVFRGRVA